MKIKKLVLLSLLSILMFSCKKDDTVEPFDAASQAITDDNALIEYLQSHYLNDEDGGIYTINSGETALINDVETQIVMKDDISYKLYYLKQQEGVTTSPTEADSVLTTYTGTLLDSTVFDSTKYLTWFSLTDVIDGWSYGFTHFKGGNRILRDDESFYYENVGTGLLLIPSGLAYGNRSQGLIPINSPLVFQITLNDVNDSDHDNDGVLSILEDIDNDKNVKNDDTDEDGIPNYLDTDDDGDGILTKDELEDKKYLDPNR